MLGGRQFVFLMMGLALFHLSLIFQGVDLADEGYWMSNAQFFFSDPRSVMYGFSCWLTVLSSAVWSLFISPTLLAARVHAVIVKLFLVVFAWLILRKTVPARPLWIGLAWGSMLTYGGTMALYGSSYSAFYYLGAMCFFYKAVMDSPRVVWLYVSGFMLGLAVFARISNLSGLAFGVLPFVWCALYRKISWREFICITLHMLSGASVAVGLGLALMVYLGHWPVFYSMLELFRQIGAEGHHSVGTLIVGQLRYYLMSLFFVLPSVLVCILLPRLIRSCECVGVRVFRTGIPFVAGVAAVVFVLMCHRYFGFEMPKMYMFGLVLVGVLAALVLVRDVRFKFLCWGGLILVAVLPMGSNVPGGVIKYAFPFIIPLVCHAVTDDGAVIELVRRVGSAQEPESSLVVKCLRIFLCGVFVAGLIHVGTDSIRDCPNRLRLTSETDIPLLSNVHTTSERAAALNNIVNEVKILAHKDTPLLVFPNMPALYAYSGRCPFVGGTWTRLFQPCQLAQELENAERRFGSVLPIVVKEKMLSGNETWPNSEDPVEPGDPCSWDYIQKFMDRHQYVKVHDGKLYDAWVPKSEGLNCEKK